MKICDHYDHHEAQSILLKKSEIFKELSEIGCNEKLIFGKSHSSDIKKIISNDFNRKGWADKVKVGKSNISINFLKSKTGVCFQIGNVARTYADILKLMYLYDNGIIDVGVIYVPHKIESKLMGKNYAQFDRLASELNLFLNTVNIPILVIGLSN